MYVEVAQLIFFILSQKRVRAELFSAMKQVEPLIPAHNDITEQIDNYLEREELKLERLRRYLNFFKKDVKTMKRVDEFENNPINIFSLIHKLTQEIRVIEDKLWIEGEPKLSALLDLPCEADLQGAALALGRLQRTYALDVTQLAAGIIRGTFNHDNKLYVKKTSPMTISATFQVGQRLYQIGLFENALHWMYEALDKYYHRDKQDPYTGDEINIIDYIRRAHHKMKEFSNAMEWTEILMQLRPTQSHLYKNNMVFYQNQLSNKKEVEYNNKSPKNILDSFAETNSTRSLYCFYKNGPSPFLFLAPIRAEVLSKDPNVYLIHDIMSEASESAALPPKSFLKEETVILNEADEIDEELDKIDADEDKIDVKEDKIDGEDKIVKEEDKIDEEVDEIDEEEDKIDDDEDTIDKKEKIINTTQFQEDTVDHMCRGEISMAEDAKKGLYCFYKNGPSPFLRLAPVKAELLCADPDVYMFHDVISDAEIAFVINVSLPLLKPQMVTSEVAENLRVSQTCWLKDEVSPTILRLTVRVSDITGLDFETAESLQVANYGVGGHYDVHWDIANKDYTCDEVPTFMFYMSEVEQGGATVFFHRKLTVWPVKNAAIFWKNALPTGIPDLRTIHAACPVLIGSKWVANKWLHPPLIKRGLDYEDHSPKPVLTYNGRS